MGLYDRDKGGICAKEGESVPIVERRKRESKGVYSGVVKEGIMVEALLDSRATGLVMSSEFARKQGFKLKRLDRPMNVRNVNGSLNKEGPIEHMVEVNILSGS